MAYVPVPKDLTKVKTKVALNLTKRQLIFFSLAAVVGIPFYELLGERICAFVIPDKMKQITDGAELKKNLEVKGIARYKLPDQILLIDSFPVTPVNKIDKAMLRNLASKQKGR